MMISETGRSQASMQPAAAVSSGTGTESPDPAQFRQQFYADLQAVTRHSTVINCAVEVSEEAWTAMQEDPAYREQMLALVARDLGSSYAPRPASVLIRIGPTSSDYRADSWPVGYDGEFYARLRGTAGDTKTKRSSSSEQQKLLAARHRAAYRMQQQALEAAALRHAEQSALLSQQPAESSARLAVQAYNRSDTTLIQDALSQVTDLPEG